MEVTFFFGGCKPSPPGNSKTLAKVFSLRRGAAEFLEVPSRYQFLLILFIMASLLGSQASSPSNVHCPAQKAPSFTLRLVWKFYHIVIHSVKLLNLHRDHRLKRICGGVRPPSPPRHDTTTPEEPFWARGSISLSLFLYYELLTRMCLSGSSLISLSLLGFRVGSSLFGITFVKPFLFVNLYFSMSIFRCWVVGLKWALSPLGPLWGRDPPQILAVI